MSDDDPDDTPADDAAEPDQSDADAPDADDQPEIGDEEMADWSAVGDEVADDPDDEGEDDTTEQDTDADQDLGGMDPGAMQTSLGDVYCNALGLGAAVARDRYGDLDRDRADAMDEYADLARQLELDQYVDEWLKQQGGVDQLGPGQAAMLMSVMFPVLVCMDDPELASNAMEGINA